MSEILRPFLFPSEIFSTKIETIRSTVFLFYFTVRYSSSPQTRP